MKAFFMGTSVTDALYGFRSAQAIANLYYITGSNRPESNQLLGIFAPYGEQILADHERVLSNLLYSLDPTNEYYPFNPNDPQVSLQIQSSMPVLEQAITAAAALAEQSGAYYERLTHAAFTVEQYEAKNAVHQLWKKSLAGLLDVHTPATQETVVSVIKRLMSFMPDSLKGDSYKIQSKGLNFLTDGAPFQTELGQTVVDFYQRYTGTPGNSNYLKSCCDAAAKDLGKYSYFFNTEGHL
jgi:hypothetical protein